MTALSRRLSAALKVVELRERLWPISVPGDVGNLWCRGTLVTFVPGDVGNLCNFWGGFWKEVEMKLKIKSTTLA